jgi:hypothetical protein
MFNKIEGNYNLWSWGVIDVEKLSIRDSRVRICRSIDR